MIHLGDFLLLFRFFLQLPLCLYLDAVNGHLANACPRLGRVHELSVLDLVLDVNILVERELARQRHVDDHAQGPHVQGPVEALLLQYVGVEDLGREVGGRSHDRLAKGLLADDSRVAEIAQFDLNTPNKLRFYLHTLY